MSNERDFRQMLSQKVSASTAGLWLLVPEYLRLGAWNILKGWTGKQDTDLEPRMALQVANESAMCVNRIRKKDSLSHQGFQLLNGMGQMITDTQIHYLLNAHSMEQTQQMLHNLALQRKLLGHYVGKLISMDPHRLISTSKRVMSKKQKYTEKPAEKMIQTYFSVCAETGQPIMLLMGSTGRLTSEASRELVKHTAQVINNPAIVVADKEHFIQGLFETTHQHPLFDLLCPVIKNGKVSRQLKSLDYTRRWAGFFLDESEFSFNKDDRKYRLIAQRTGEIEPEYAYNGFITTSEQDAKELVCDKYTNRWSVETFFNFEKGSSLDRASTHNLNIRYGKMALAMLGQAACYQLRQKLHEKYQKWNAQHLAREVLAYADGDVRVKDDTIVVTFYGPSEHIKKEHYENLPHLLAREGLDPKIPWLYNFKLDFRFK